MTGCPEEQQSQHPQSPGLVEDAETVCRAAYDPMHYRGGSLRSAFVRASDLQAGQLSVWRLERDPQFTAAAVAAVLSDVCPQGSELRQVLAGNVEAIRSFEMPDVASGARIFCVCDDCATDEEGGFHPEHATIRLESIDGLEWKVGTVPFDVAREALVNLLRAQVVWPLAA